MGNNSMMEIRLIIVTSLTAAQVLHDTLDELEDTSYYRQSLKSATKRLQNELTKTCDQHIDTIWKGDEQTARQVMDGIIEISKAIVKMKPSQLAVFGDLLKTGDLKYEENGQ
jgi:DNA-binding FadR family transcriptional regulator